MEPGALREWRALRSESDRLRAEFAWLQALPRTPFDFAAHRQLRARLRAFAEKLHAWRERNQRAGLSE